MVPLRSSPVPADAEPNKKTRVSALHIAKLGHGQQRVLIVDESR